MKKRYALLFLIACFISPIIQAQNCESSLIFKLVNTSGGFHVNQVVKLTSLADNKVYTASTNEKGEAGFTVPCDQNFDVDIANYPSKKEAKSPVNAGSKSTMSYTYAPDMVQKQKEFLLSDAEKATLDAHIKSLPDTTRIFQSVMNTPAILTDYATMDITLKGLDGKFLVGEEITFSGKQRNKSFVGKTNAKGTLRVYLPKGDIYTINFHYHKGYKIHEVTYSKGTSTARIDITYMGTVEYLRRKKIEDERIKEELKQVEEALRREENEFKYDQVVATVLDRNKWEEKLFICDVSYEMLPYASKLAQWYKANEAKETNTQFIFFFNGIKRPNATSSCVFYQKAEGYDKLMLLIANVHAKAGMETCTNNVEGLITNLGIQNPYKEIVLLVDKDRELTDYEYLCQLGKPVHVVMCVDDRTANAQHLTIAWKTKGSIHTMDQDIVDIGKKVEGDIVTVRGTKYKLMGGQFVVL